MRSCVGRGGVRSRQGKTVKQITDNPEMQQQMKARLEELKESDVLAKLAQHPIEEVLHYLLLYCAANRGLKPKELDALRREFLLVSPFPPFHAQNFGLQQLPLLGLLERAGLLAPRGSAPSFASVRSKMRLIRDDVDGSQRSDLK